MCDSTREKVPNSVAVTEHLKHMYPHATDSFVHESKNNIHHVEVQERNDSFSVRLLTVTGKPVSGGSFNFDQESSVEDLRQVFLMLGYHTSFEEVY